MHYYKFNIKAWTRETAHLTLEEEGVYRRLLDFYYDSESPIPVETKSVIRRLRLAGHEDAVETILSEFFVLGSDGYRQSYCDDVIAAYHSKAEANRANGRKGGRPEKPKENPVGSENKPTDNLNKELLITNQELETPPLSPAGGKTKASRKCRIPDQFLLTKEMREWAQDAVPAVNLKTETENFCDYWRGQGGTKADWVATWRTWMRKAQADTQRGGRGGYKPFNKQEAIEAANQRVVDQVIAQEEARKLGLPQQPEIDLGDAIVIDGEVINAD